jgi:uncharacterized repeat protein (TIGR03803 family)
VPLRSATRVARQSRTESTVFGFTNTTGGNPGSGPIADGVGALYGTTRANGTYGYGTAYKIVPSGSSYVLSRLYNFHGNYTDGSEPFAGLLLDSSQALYGTTSEGGDERDCPSGCGIVFKLNQAHGGYDLTVLYRFQGGTDGIGPSSTLIEDKAGALYGTTFSGGPSKACRYGCGTVYKLTPSGGAYSESILYSFQNGNDGEYPEYALTLDARDALYGTAYGGATGQGVVYKLTPSGSGYVESTLFTFKGGPDGAVPSSGVVFDGAGGLYGTAQNGGSGACAGSPPGCGVVYKLSPVHGRYREHVLYSFQGGGSDGQLPMGINKVGNNIYGITEIGAGGCFSQGCGTVYELERQGESYVEHVLYTFQSNDENIIYPVSGLATAKHGTVLFGAAYEGQTNGLGGVFEVRL